MDLFKHAFITYKWIWVEEINDWFSYLLGETLVIQCWIHSRFFNPDFGIDV